MKFEALRRSLVRWLRPAATSVPPKKTNAIADAILAQLRAQGLVPPDAQVVVREVGTAPPADPPTDGWTWAKWSHEQQAAARPGWTFCRFANRTGRDSVAFVFGVARGQFGVWCQPFDVCRGDDGPSQHLLACLTHLPSGLGLGIFEHRDLAVEAAALVERVCDGWEACTEGNHPRWDENFARARTAWKGIGITYSADTHCHDTGGQVYGLYSRTIESIIEGRPEKLS